MKIILAFPTADHHTGFYIQQELLAMGHDVRTMEPVKSFMKLYDMASEWKPDLVLCSRSGQLFHDIQDIRATMPEVGVCVFNTDSRSSLNAYASEFGDDLVKLFRIADCVYCVAKNEATWLEMEDIRAQWLVQGCYPPVDYPPDIDRYEHEVSFLGDIDYFHDSRVELMRMVSRMFDLNIEPAYGVEASKTYYQTKVNLGHAHTPLSGENSVRDFKIMGSGGFLITRWYDGIEEVYGDELYKCMDVYKKIPECIEKIRYWLDRDEEREAIAAHASEVMHREHTYRHRLEVILKGCE